MSDSATSPALLKLTARIVAAHLSKNTTGAETLPALIQSVYASLASVGQPAVEPERPQPAVPVKKSVFPDYIICLEDGKKLKMLKRHLQSTYNMTPDQYRHRWGLAPDYPMVAPNYAQHRSSLAKSIGLGRKPRGQAPDAAEPDEAEPAPAAKPRRRRVAAAETAE